MKRFHLLFSLYCLSVACPVLAQPAYREIQLSEKTAFASVTSNWRITDGIWYSLTGDATKEKAGTGTLVCEPSGRNQAPLMTKMQHGNIAVQFDFMLASGSSAAVYLQGRYGIGLTDSWKKDGPVTAACGNIMRSRPQSIPPRMNVARAPGLWQHMTIVFQAPKFSPNAKKEANARLLQVSLNGVPVHEDVILPAISTTVFFNEEAAKGPLVFSGDSRIAIRNIRYIPFEDEQKDEMLLPSPVPVGNATPLIVTPTFKTVVQRCFMAGEHHAGGDLDGAGDDPDTPRKRKLTSCAAVGEPGQIHYAIDLEQGSVIRLWKGAFIDATTMWQSRGAIQLARPLGSVIKLPSQPVFAYLKDLDAIWPDSMQHGYRFVQYRLDEHSRPTFNYSFRGSSFSDRIVPADDDRILTRTLRLVEGKPENELWILLAAGSGIEDLGDGLYGINDKNYYIRLGAGKQKEVILRQNNGRDELLIPGHAITEDGITWSFIW